MEYRHAVVIGRFQPFHNDHLRVVEHGLEIADQVIVVIGSSNAAPSTKNPFTLRQRSDMIRWSIPNEAKRRRVHIVGVRDHYYNDQVWLADVQAKTDPLIQDGEAVALLGSYKDSSSYYLKMFPQWEFVPVRTGDINSTDIREYLLSHTVLADWEGVPVNYPSAVEMEVNLGKLVPMPVLEELNHWVSTTRLYPNLCREFKYQKDYKKSWESSPFPPTFVTADAIVVCSGHVLVIERKINPGKGLFALPGGFIRQNEFIEDAAIRELREETGIRLNPNEIRKMIAGSRVFDYPTRSERGRTITHGFYVKLPDGKLPEVKAGDDAKRAFWMPLFEAFGSEEKFFEDHLHIINSFVGVQGERR